MTYLLYLRPFRGSLISAVYFRREWELNPKQKSFIPVLKAT